MTTKILKTTGGIYNETPEKTGALLLVGVLALSLLTACGGSGSTSQDAQAEAAVMAAINQNRSGNDKLQNSSELRKIANQDLDAAIKFGNLSSSFTYKDHTDLKNGKFGGTFIAKCDYKNTDLAKLIKTDTNINSHNMNSWSDVGVVVRTDNGQTYIAISAVFKFQT